MPPSPTVLTASVPLLLSAAGALVAVRLLLPEEAALAPTTLLLFAEHGVTFRRNRGGSAQ